MSAEWGNVAPGPGATADPPPKPPGRPHPPEEEGLPKEVKQRIIAGISFGLMVGFALAQPARSSYRAAKPNYALSFEVEMLEKRVERLELYHEPRPPHVGGAA